MTDAAGQSCPRRRKPAMTASLQDHVQPVLRARMDLASGLVAAGVLVVEPATGWAATTALAARALRAWAAGGQNSPLVLPLAPEALHGPNAAARILGALEHHALPMGRVLIEVREDGLCERFGLRMATLGQIAATGLGLSLGAAETPSLPIGGPVRELFREVVVPLPGTRDPYAGLQGWRDDPFARRMAAAMEAAITLTARGVEGPTQAAWAARIGFIRAEGGSAWTDGRLVTRYSEARRQAMPELAVQPSGQRIRA